MFVECVGAMWRFQALAVPCGQMRCSQHMKPFVTDWCCIMHIKWGYPGSMALLFLDRISWMKYALHFFKKRFIINTAFSIWKSILFITPKDELTQEKPCKKNNRTTNLCQGFGVKLRFSDFGFINTVCSIVSILARILFPGVLLFFQRTSEPHFTVLN